MNDARISLSYFFLMSVVRGILKSEEYLRRVYRNDRTNARKSEKVGDSKVS